jgi:hypothetical protein
VAEPARHDVVALREEEVLVLTGPPRALERQRRSSQPGPSYSVMPA